MARRNRNKMQAVQNLYQNVYTQTSPDKNYAEQIEENKRLRRRLSLLEHEFQQLKLRKEQVPVVEKQKEEVTVVAAADSPQMVKLVGKGCNCKGKCASKVCGCVKKNVACSELCKCQHEQCKNQEDKENNSRTHSNKAEVSSEVSNSPNPRDPRVTRTRALGKNEMVAAPLVNKNLNWAAKPKLGLFSPDISPTLKKTPADMQVQFQDTLEFAFDSKRRLSFELDDHSLSPKDRNKTKKSAMKSRLEVPESSTKTTRKFKSDKTNGKKLISPYPSSRKEPANRNLRKRIAKPKTPTINELAGNKTKVKAIAPKSNKAAARKVKDPESENSESESEPPTIDPMKPTRQLERTPVTSSPSQIPPRISRSPVPFPTLNMEDDERIIIPSPPKELDEPHVDWEQHCKQLVPCKHCKRTFYPFRLSKHEATCKKI